MTINPQKHLSIPSDGPSLLAACGVIALTLAHLLFAGQTELIPEEAYYWTYSQHPALGYFDHPPMVAWFIGLGTALFGNTEFGVRIVAIALWPISALLLYTTGRMWFGGRLAGLAVILFCLSPVLSGFGFIVTPDAPLIFFWLLSLYGISKSLTGGRGGYWMLAGIGLGGALLSKYTAAAMTASLLLFLLLSANHRRWLRRFEPWAALLAAIGIFSPVIVWNAQNQWASFLFQSSRTIGVRHNPFHEAGMFWLYQLLTLTPILFALFFYALGPALRRGWLQRQDPWNFSMSFALPLFAVFVLASFKHKGHVNWTAPAYLSWSLAAAAVYQELQAAWSVHRPGLLRLLTGLGIVLGLSATLIGHASLAWGKPRIFSLNNAGGWQHLANEIGKARDELSQRTGKSAFIVGGDKLNQSAELGFYLRDAVDTVNDYALGAGGLGYRYWTDLKRFQGRPAIVVLPNFENYSVVTLKQKFAKVDDPVKLEVERYDGARKRTVFLVRCYGYAEAR